MIRFGSHMIFPDAYARDQYTPAEEARHEAERERDEREAAEDDPRGLGDGLGRVA